MKLSVRCTLPVVAFVVFSICGTLSAGAQVTPGGSVEFIAEAQPTGGQAEPVREMTFFLLRKSLEEIRAEVEQAEAPKNMDAFIDSLNVSAPLKTWMKAHHRVDLAGADFTKQLTADDVVDIPEFLAAYRVQNGSALDVDVPEPKPKSGDKPADREKYQQKLEQYRENLKHYIHANLDSLEGMDADLENPERQWAQLQQQQESAIQTRTLKLAQTQYLAGRTQTDLTGHGSFSGVGPGEYWLTNLDSPAMAGDLRLRWNVNVHVQPGETARVELSNLNAADPPLRSSR